MPTAYPMRASMYSVFAPHESRSPEAVDEASLSPGSTWKIQDVSITFGNLWKMQMSKFTSRKKFVSCPYTMPAKCRLVKWIRMLGAAGPLSQQATWKSYKLQNNMELSHLGQCGQHKLNHDIHRYRTIYVKFTVKVWTQMSTLIDHHSCQKFNATDARQPILLFRHTVYFRHTYDLGIRLKSWTLVNELFITNVSFLPISMKPHTVNYFLLCMQEYARLLQCWPR